MHRKVFGSPQMQQQLSNAKSSMQEISDVMEQSESLESRQSSAYSFDLDLLSEEAMVF